MQNLSDKELDKLFKDKLENAAVAPPTSRWSAIEKEIQPGAKSRLPIYWLAAALAVVALTAGLLFNKEEKMQLHGKNDIVTAKKVPSTAVEPQTAQPEPSNDLAATRSAPLNTPTRDVVKKEEKNLKAMQPLNVKVHHPLNKAAEKTIEVEVLPVKTNVVPAETELMAQVPPKSTPAPVALLEEEPAAKSGIRNVGDLVNFVVDKVDKRERKFLKFKTDDDDNSELVAINIGIIKFNPREK